jgi:hypothetical protein
MIFTGNNYLSISNQTGLSFNLNISLNNNAGICNLGFTGANSGQINFKLSSGRVLDPENRVVSFYSPQENINVSGDISPNNYSYYINNNLLCLNGKRNNFIITGYYINTSGCLADSTISILGTKPNYQLNLNPIFYIQEGSYIEGTINNSDGLTFKIYSGTVDVPSGFNIYALPQFVTNNEIFRINHYPVTQNQVEDERAYQIQVNFFTNFGQVTKNFTSVGSFSGFYNFNLNLNDLTDYFARTGIETALGAVRNNNYYINISLESGNLRTQTKIFNKNIYTKLEYFGGITGIVTGDIFASGYKNFTLTNYITESGYLTGITTLSATGYHALSGVYVTGTISGSRSEFSYFTGYAVDDGSLRSFTGYYLNIPFVKNRIYPISGFTSTGKYYYQGYIYDLDRLTNIKSIVNLPYNNQDRLDITKSNYSGTILLVNSINEPSISYSIGVVRIYTGNGVNFNLTKTYSGLKGDIEFGRAISIDQEGKNFTISALRELPGFNTFSGRVYTFTGLNQDINTVPYIEGTGYRYGYSTALNSGNILAISKQASFLNISTTFGASVEIYKKIGTSWNKIKTISGDPTNHDDYFGVGSISINNQGDILLVGASENNYETTGCAYIFTGNNNLTDYGLLTKLKGGLSIYDQFGYYTSLNKEGNIASVAPAANSGYVCIYTGNKNNFVQTNTINYPGANIGYNSFGTKIKLNDSGNFLISNAPTDNSYYGYTYVYSGNNNTWTNTKRIDPFNVTNTPSYGFVIDDFVRRDNVNVYFGTNYNVSTEIFTYLDYSGYVDQYIIGAGNISNTDNYLLTGLLTGQTYIKEFSGAFNMFTGYYSGGIVIGLTNFNSGNYFTGLRYANSGIINSGLNQLYYQITTKNYFDNNQLTGKLTISGYNDDSSKNNTIIRYITGIK